MVGLSAVIVTSTCSVGEAKRTLIHDHIDHCLTGGPSHDIAEIKALTRFL